MAKAWQLLLPPVWPREIKSEDRGRLVYLGICVGCHAYTGRLAYPAEVIQALYRGNPVTVLLVILTT